VGRRRVGVVIGIGAVLIGIRSTPGRVSPANLMWLDVAGSTMAHATRGTDVVVVGAEMDVGNAMRRRYVGRLAVALVTGRIAGRSAAESD